MSLKSNYEYIRDWCNHKFLTKDEQVSVDLSNYYTKSEVDSAITDATDDIDLSNYVTDSELATGLSTKQNTISDLSTIRSNAAAGAAKVSNVQSDWNATSGLARILNKPDLDDYLTIEDYTQDEEVVAAALNDLNSNKQATLVSGTNIKTVNGTSLLGSGDIDVNLAESITWSALKTLRDNSNLVVGKLYRITDYVTTTVQTGTRSAGHAFDLVVIATAVNALSEDAKAILHNGDTYFANSDLNAWKVSYTIDNDDTRYTWADTTNGKGVIFHLVDEYANDCPYDFKNIQFLRDTTWIQAHQTWCNNVLGSTPSSDMYFYTFTWENGGVIEDATILVNTLTDDADVYRGIYANVIKESSADEANSFKFMLSSNVFCSSASFDGGLFYGMQSNTLGRNCNSNTFGSNCSANTFGNSCSDNTFGDDCSDNTFGNYCSYNTFGRSCLHNTFRNGYSYNTFGDDCDYNIFGNSVSHNTFGNECRFNTFGNSHSNNTFGNNCSGNAFADSCGNNTFGNNCSYNTFGNDCHFIIFGNYCRHASCQEGVKYINVAAATSSAIKHYFTILAGTNGTSDSNLLTIPIVAGQTYSQFAGMDSDGNLRVWCVADRDPKLVSISTASSTQSLVWGTMYQWTVNPTSITVTLPSAPSDPRGEIVLKFTTGSTAPTMTWPSSLKWANGEELTVEASTTYEFSIGYDMMGGWTIVGCGFSAAS